MKLLITGGHFTPTLSFIEVLQKKYPSLSIVFVGRKFISDSEKTHSLEYKEIEKRNLRFIHLETGRLTRIVSLKTIMSLFRIPLGFVNAFRIIHNERPTLVFSFGGYIALPIVFWAYCFRIPVYTHEQTIHPGLANRIIGKFAKKVFVAFKETVQYFSKNKVIVTGNPVRESIITNPKRPHKIGFISKDRPVIYATGGSLGSHSINLHVFSLLPKLLKKYIVIHQIGDTKEYEDYNEAIRVKKLLPPSLKQYYYPRKHFFEDEIGYIYSLTDLVVGRAGANTFFELIALQKPALFIPLPWAAYNEQEKHAEIFKKHKTGEIFHQSDTSKNLLRLIEKMMKNLELYKKNFTSLQHLYKKNAATFIVKEIPELR